MAMTDLPVKIPGLDACAVYVAGRRVSGTGPYRHSRSHACYIGSRERIFVRRHG